MIEEVRDGIDVLLVHIKQKRKWSTVFVEGKKVGDVVARQRSLRALEKVKMTGRTGHILKVFFCDQVGWALFSSLKSSMMICLGLKQSREEVVQLYRSSTFDNN